MVSAFWCYGCIECGEQRFVMTLGERNLFLGWLQVKRGYETD